MAETREQWKARMGIGQRNTVAQLVGGDGTTRTTPVQSDERHGMTGTRTEHWSGRVDATCNAPSITVNPNLKGRLHGKE